LRLPPPVFATVDEVTAHVRRHAVAKRNYAATGLENAKASLNALSRLPSVERCQTFRLPEAATELFLRAENWHFRDYDKTLPLFVPSSFEKNFEDFDIYDDIDVFNMFYDDTLEYYSPEWIEIGVAEYEERVFLMCIDPDSKEFGHRKSFHYGGGSESIEMVCDESNYENGKNFLRFLERDAEIFSEKEGQMERDDSVFMGPLTGYDRELGY